MWFPSFLTFPINLPALPSISLPANIQRRFLSYVLKRALGRFVVASGLDVERIQAQISQGWVELERLEVDANEINSLIPEGLPFTVTSGEVAKVSARVPFPNLWSDPLSLTVDSLTLEVAITPPSSKAKSPATFPGASPTAHHIDLSQSVTSAADDFVHDELDAFDGAELDRSIRESLILSHTDPFNNDDVPGAFPPFGSSAGGGDFNPLPAEVESTTVLASLVERILARLECKVRNVRLRVRYEDDDRSGILELRLGEVRYADETPENAAGGKTIRLISVSSVSVYLLPLPTPAPSSQLSSSGLGLRPAFSRSSSSSDSEMSMSTDSSHDEFHDMVMSQAVYDLRQSTADMRQSTMTSASGMSIYHSMVQEEEEETLATPPPPPPRVPEPPLPVQHPKPEKPSSRDTSRSATPTGPSEPAETLLLSFGSEDIALRMTTTRPPPPEPMSPGRVPTSPRGTPTSPRRAATPEFPSLDIELTFGTISAVLLPSHAAFILAVGQAAVGPTSAPKQPEPGTHTDSQVVQSQPRFDARVRVKGIYIASVYDLASPTEEYETTVQQFFLRPASVYLPIGHLRLRLEDIAAAYHVPSFTGVSPRKRADPRRKPTLGPKPPVITLTVADASVFEYLASAESGDDEPPGGAFPVLIFDANLPRQYEVPPGAPSSLLLNQMRTPSHLPSFPEFDSVDWRNSGNQKRSGEKAWRVRPKGKGILRATAGASPDPPRQPAVSIRKEMSDKEPALIDLLPVHIFLDLSLVERLLPLLRSLAPLVQSKSDFSSTPTAMHPGVRPMAALRPVDSIGDLGGKIHRPSLRPTQQHPTAPHPLVKLACPMIRLDIRCPAPLNRRGSWGDGAHLRSGIVTLDIHGLNVSMAADPAVPPSLTRRGSQGPFEPPPEGGINVEWQKMVFLFSRVPERRSSAFLVIGPLAPEPGDDESVLLPTVHVHSEVAPFTGIKTKSVTCRIPCVQAKIRQPVVEGLQFFADDMTHWLDGAFGDGSAPRPRDDLKMIGSRFFGSKASSSASSSAVEDEEDDPVATLLRVVISEAEVTLLVPKSTAATVKEVKEAAAEAAPERILSLRASDLDVKLESNMANKQETSVTLTAMDADLFHHPDPDTEPARLFGRTTPLTLTTHTQPLVNLRFSSLTHPDRTKETGIRLTASACTVFITKDLDWVNDLRLYVKTPEGVFEDVVPSEVTRIHLWLNDCSAHVATPTLPGAILVVANFLELRTAIESEADDSAVDIGLTGVHLLAIDDLAAATPLQMGHQMSIDAWKRAGYAPLVELVSMDAQVLQGIVPEEIVLLDVLQAKVRVTACADSLASLGGLAGDLAKLGPPKPVPQEQPRRQMALDQSIDVFASVDLQAFNHAPDIVSDADMIGDDLPTNLDYLDHAARQSTSGPSTDRTTGESLRSWQTTDDAPHISEVHGGTIKVFVTEPFAEDANYWDSLPVVTDGDSTRVGKTRIRVQNASVNVFFHDGYDWAVTRKAIEDEIKAVRRKLEKFKQLLASGQKADASIDDTSSVLFNSVYIGFDQNQRDDMDNAALIAAIDEELEDLGAADTASLSSWQSFPDAGPPAAAAAAAAAAASKRSSHVRLHGKRLTRSKRAQLEFALDGVRADIDVYPADDATASRMHVTARAFEILDHIKTSTWKKFLTEMKSDSRGNVRETDADMVRLEVVNVRPNLPSTDEEIRLRAKILPLRLHVDQDALDFLKHFFSFKPLNEEVVEVADDVPKAEPFFQHVEIFPVELKLDYKPKRVDYTALRQGKTIELMNFFHFDGAEMTLRHVTLSGVTGGTRLGDMLQDIWTPDVKANQLADVISGVSPIRSMVNVGSGVADLILLPIEQYRKDGRVARGVQRGTHSFVRSTAMEMMKLGARLATGTQVVLERAEGVLGDGGDGGGVGAGSGSGAGAAGSMSVTALAVPSGLHDGSSDDEGGAEEKSRYANQPNDVREGLRGAYASLSTNINSAAQTILAVPMEVYERSNDDGALKAVVRAVPIAVLKPMIGASEAVSKTLWGLRNTLDPEGRREQGDKYK